MSQPYSYYKPYFHILCNIPSSSETIIRNIYQYLNDAHHYIILLMVKSKQSNVCVLLGCALEIVKSELGLFGAPGV